MKTIQALIVMCVLGCQAQAQVSFVLSSTNTLGNGPVGVTTADVNMDGKMDLISANYYGNSLSVLTNNGSGGYVLSGTYNVGTNPRLVVAADVNGDGKVDLICANSYSGDSTLSVLTNTGTGGFVPAGTYHVGIGPAGLTAADVNGDGKVDLISANWGSGGEGNTLTVLTNNGSGVFGSNATINVGNGAYSVVAADVSGDGKVDLISANQGANNLSVLTNNGGGGFVLSGTYPVGSGPALVTAADVNGDGKVDLISANSGGNTLTVLTNNGSGIFGSNATINVGSSPNSVAAADVNGDGKVDLISANYNSKSLSVLTNNGSGGFVLATNLNLGYNPNWVTAADVNGNGKVDLITPIYPGNFLDVLTNATPFSGYGQVAFTLSSTNIVGNNPFAVVAVDINGDGKADLISANSGGNTLSVMTNGGSGMFVLVGTYQVGNTPYSVTAADVNGDGKVDLISANANDNTLTVLTNNGSSGFVLASSPSVGAHPVFVATADVNGDGKLDLISVNQYGHSLSVLTNNGSGGFVLSSSPNVGNLCSWVATADVNRDGKVDLICANYSDNSLTVLTNNGSGGFVLATNLTVGSEPDSVVAADVNRDGKVDLISANSGNNTLTVFTNSGSGIFGSNATINVGNTPYSVVAADVNGDGKVDLICANTGGNTLTVLTNNGSGGFVLATNLSVGNTPYSVTAADLNWDGKVDLICANYNDNTLSVLLNSTSFPPLGSPPTITNQPASQIIGAGSNVTFTVGVSGTGPFSYQWLFNSNAIPANGIITTVAGGGTGGLGDGGTATNGSLNQPYCETVDAYGNLFIADLGHNRIRKVDTNGIITTFAGNGTGSYAGDGGAATNASLNGPYSAAVDASGNLFIADLFNHRIRKVSTNGIITTVAGNGTGSYSGDGGAATNASLNTPHGVTVDSSGNLFIADWGNNRIRKVSTNGIITTFAGGGTGGLGDGGAATNASLSGPVGVALDSFGNLFIGDAANNRVREVNINGIIMTVAGNGTGSYSGDGGAATNANLKTPNGVVVDAYGNLFVGDTANNRVREVNINRIIMTVAGNGTGSYSGDGGAATNASLNAPNGVAVDTYGNLFIGDSVNSRIRKVGFGGSPALTLNNITTTNAGSYQVIVTGPYGSITSSVAVLTIVVPSRTATATAIVSFGFLVAITNLDGGSGYTNIPQVQFIGGGGSGAQAIALVNNGVVTGIQVLNAGFGYTNAPQVVIDPPFIFNPVLGIAPMSFLSFSNLTIGGAYQLQQAFLYYWTNLPVNFIATNPLYTQMVAGVAGSGSYRLALNPVPTQAFATPQVVDGFVVAAMVTSGGSGYVTSPVVTIVGLNIIGAGAYSTISGGVVTGITVTNAGYGYTNTVSLQIAPPPAAAVIPTVLPVMRVDSANLAPFDNYQMQFKPDITAPWINWNGGLFTPTGLTNSQYIFITNSIGYFRLQYVP